MKPHLSLARPLESIWPGALRRSAGIAWMEWRLILRSGLFRLAAFVCWGLSALLVHGVMTLSDRNLIALLTDASDSCAAAMALQIILFAPPMVGFLAASSSSRERSPGISETLLATPPSTEELAVGKFVAVAAASILLLAGIVAAAWLWLQYGEGHAARLTPFWLVAMRWWQPILYMACLGFAAGLVLPGPAGGALVFFYWLAVCLATGLVSSVFMPVFGYLSPGYLCVGVGLLMVVAVVYERRRRGAHLEQALLAGLAGLALIVGGCALLARAVLSYNTPPFHLDRELLAESGRTAVPGKPMPYFLAVDTRGQLITPETLRGRPSVLIILAAIPPPVPALPLCRALDYGNRHSGRPPVNLDLLMLTRDPADAAPNARNISPTMRAAAIYGRPGEDVVGLPAMLGLDWRSIAVRGLLPGVVVVLDSEGRLLGRRPLYEVITPPPLVSLMRTGSFRDPDDTPSQVRADEQAAAVRFFQALWQYDRSHAGGAHVSD